MKRFILYSLFLTIGIMGVQSAVPEGYYDSLNGLTGRALRKAAANRVRSHTAISYSSGTWTAFEKTDTRINSKGEKVWWDMYSNNEVAVSTGHGGLNVEHSVPNSWWGGTKNDAYKDLFHLNPSNADANSRKGNYPLSEISTYTWDNGVTFVGKPVSGQGGGASLVYEPADEYKGDFARAYMYMFSVYEDIAWKSNTNWMYEVGSEDMFKPWAVALLLKWHRQDPVSQKEIDRNNAIYSVQRNRNPYIDSPELAEYVWGNKKGQKYYYNGVVTPDPDPDPDPDPTPDPTPDPVGLQDGSWVMVTSPAEINSIDEYIVVASKSNVGMTTESHVASNAAYLKPSGVMNVEDVEGRKVINSPSSDLAVLKFMPAGDKFTAMVYDSEGNSKGYLSSTSAKKFEIVSSSSDATSFALTASDDTMLLDFGTSGKLFYNASAPRFTTYTTTGQEKTSLYRKYKISTTILIPEAEGNSASKRIFNLQGVELGSDISKLEKGLYIIVSPSGETSKILIK